MSSTIICLYNNHIQCLVVYLDQEVLDLVKERFGAWAFATKKVRRMMFWLPRLRYTNKYLDRTLQEQRHTELSFAQLAKMGLEQMSRDKGATITYSKVCFFFIRKLINIQVIIVDCGLGHRRELFDCELTKSSATQAHCSNGSCQIMFLC